MTTYNSYKNGVKKSNNDVTSGLPCLLAAETASGQNLKKPQNLANGSSETGKAKQHKKSTLGRPIEK